MQYAKLLSLEKLVLYISLRWATMTHIVLCNFLSEFLDF